MERSTDRRSGRTESLAPGERLDRYEVIARIGEGGMGEVFRARDTELGREVAIKILPPEVGEDSHRRQRFQQEARAASACNHPNLLAVHDVGRQRNIHYLVTELLRGESLRQRLQRGRLPVSEALDLAIQTARGLSAAHERGIVHRDLKPENLFVTEDGTLKILDFGIARHIGERKVSTSELDNAETREALTGTGMLIGTVGYMAPEQIAGAAVDARADVFSLGCVLYELLTGNRAFGGDTAAELIGAALTAEPPSLADSGVAAPPALEEVLRRCLAKKRENRFESAEQLVGALENARGTLDGGSAETLVRRLAAAGTRPRWERAAAIVAGALVLAALFVLLARRGNDSPPAASSSPPDRIDSLAVLPLANHSGSADQDYFADGMTEALIAELSRIRALKVISRTSVMRFKGTTRPLPDIGRELGVRGLIEGSVAGDGERVRVTVQLIDAMTDTHLWTETYTRPARDLLGLQAEVANAIAREIRVVITPEEQRRAADARPVDPQAHRFVLQARQVLENSDYQRDAVAAAVDLSRRALELDPDFALGHATLGLALLTGGRAGHRLMLDACRDARQAADEAFALEPDLPEAKLLVATLQMSCDFDWAGAERGFRELLEMMPGDAEAHIQYALLLSSVGRHQESDEHARRAGDLDPLNEQILGQRAQNLVAARRYDDAIAHLHDVLAVFPESAYAQWCLGLALTVDGDLERGLEVLRARRVPNPGMNFVAGYAHGRAGRRREAEEVLHFLLERRERDYVPAGMIAIVYGGLGDLDAGIDWLSRAIDERSSLIEALAVDPIYDPLREDPRFPALLARIGLDGVDSAADAAP